MQTLCAVKRYIDTTSQPVSRASSYCYCPFPKSSETNHFNGNIHETIKCRCGEEEDHATEWLWEKKAPPTQCFIDGPNITFHPVYSQGTSVIRGERSLERGRIHYWEIKIISVPTGTDVMIGIGTEKVCLNCYQYHFASLLGLDDQSWGFSYRGKTHHNGIFKQYGQKLSQGCIVGVYVDLVHGFIEFYINREPLGIAYQNIPLRDDVKLYPMVCSTAAKSSIKLLNSTSCELSLQINCIRSISTRKDLLARISKMPGLKYLLKKSWFLLLKPKYENEMNNISLADEAVILSCKSKKHKIEDADDDDCTDLYKNAHKIFHKICDTTGSEDSDEETHLASILSLFHGRY